MDDQFQITLPCNSSFKYYPQNTGNAYTTHLPYALTLNGQWEVALMDIQYQFSGQNIQKDIKLGVIVHRALKRQPELDEFDQFCYDQGLDGNTLTDEEAIEYHKSKTDEQLRLCILNRGGKRYNMITPFGYCRTTIPAGYYRQVTNLLSLITTKITEAFAFMEMKRAPVSVWYLADKDRVRINAAPNLIVTLVSDSSYLATLLGQPVLNTRPDGFNILIITPQENGDLEMISSKPPSLDPLTTMYVYTDIVKWQLVGDGESPLLGVVPIKGDLKDVSYFTFPHPYYVPLERHEISEINLKLKTDTGDPFPLVKNGKVVCRLHFRRKHLL